jgi:pimeloyl-ACP methyl ester carboxylesterase
MPIRIMRGLTWRLRASMEFGASVARSLLSAVALAVASAACTEVVRTPPRAELEAARARPFARSFDEDGLPRVAWSRALGYAAAVTVYVEGDGRAWRGSRRPPRNPTPRTSVVVPLALEDDGPVIYLARPCQYVDRRAFPTCTPRWWTDARYSEPAVAALDATLDRLLRAAASPRLTLVGHSGGATIAALLAERRTDVEALITIAGVLDTDAWAAWHGVTPLSASLNPIARPRHLATIPQVHLTGSRDRIVPPALLGAALERLGRPRTAAHVTVEGYDHRCCWDRAALLRHACSTAVALPTAICGNRHAKPHPEQRLDSAAGTGAGETP